jgi:hypothetical protein
LGKSKRGFSFQREGVLDFNGKKVFDRHHGAALPDRFFKRKENQKLAQSMEKPLTNKP